MSDKSYAFMKALDGISEDKDVDSKEYSLISVRPSTLEHIFEMVEHDSKALMTPAIRAIYLHCMFGREQAIIYSFEEIVLANKAGDMDRVTFWDQVKFILLPCFNDYLH